ncbi:MAG TPA: EamA family transporter RarD [Polyangiaceae bacterium]|nr:EamA family transporter RarD [Polyangiaceae bacterium]
MTGDAAPPGDAPKPDTRAGGVAFSLAAYASWGIVPLYWKLLHRVAPIEILAHRVTWSLLFVGALALGLGGRAPIVGAFRARRTLALLAGTAALISFNWGLFIWAVTSGHLADASLGYFVNPLVSVALGTLVLGEKLRPMQKAAVALASVGVLVLVVGGAGFPWIGLSLAGSFGAYGLLRKIAPVEATVGLFVETVLVSPIAIGFLGLRFFSGASVLTTGTPLEIALAIGSGVITGLPLVWFSAGARRLPLSTVGLLQYVAPTLQLLIAVAVFGEQVERAKWAAFGAIWTALVVFSVDMLRRARRPPVDSRLPTVTDPAR